MTTTIGIDVGGTKVQAVVLDGTEVRADARVETPEHGGPDAVVAAIADCVEQLGGVKHIDGVGLGAPGVVDRHTGEVLRAPNLPGFDAPVPLGAMVADAVGVKRVAVANDVSVGTLAEHELGAGRGCDDLLGVFVGTGVGGGLVLRGKPYHGSTGAAGEIGHVAIRDGGRACGCGGVGHLEAYAGRASLEREARRRHADGEPTLLVELAGDGRMKSSVWRKAVEAGDTMALSLIDDAVAALGEALASATNLLDLSMVVLGGGLADKLGPGFAGRVEEATRHLLFVPGSPLRVVPAALGDLGGAMGAALIARR
ncbi:MAG: ROK family protein [Acidobacteria bacterium]|nr:ROK family protein [Acidobacteriota bacterium]